MRSKLRLREDTGVIHAMGFLLGITFGDWCELLRENRFAIDPAYWHKVVVLTMVSLRNTMYHWKEERIYSDKVAGVKIQTPLFIIGHWRTGTTLMHNLLAQDNRFAYPTLFQVSNPHTFLSREARAAEVLADVPPQTRPMDDMKITFDSPGEDEFASAASSLRSPIIGWAFPRRVQYYDQFITFDGIPEADIARWKDAFITFLKKLTWKYSRPLLLKSPTHTGRIRLLLDIFPDARFVHLHRNPYRVFQSTRRLYKDGITRSHLQHPDNTQTDEGILQRYITMYDAFFEQRELIPDGQYCDVAFEDLEADKIGQVSRIYKQLSLPGFEDLEPRLRHYVESISDYEKNKYPTLPERMRRRIAEVWCSGFKTWEYDIL